MKGWYSVLSICLTIGLLTHFAQERAPAIVFDDPVIDFGKIMQGETVKHRFRFSNQGSSNLEILSVDITCGCLTAWPSATKIPPGQSGTIEITLDTAGLTGLVDKSASVLTNDPRRRSVVLQVKAEVQPEIVLSSPSIYFESVPDGGEVTKEVIITLPAEKSIKVLSAESTEESVTVKLEPVPDSDGKKIRLIATQRPGGKIGYHLEKITVKTTSRLTPELSIYLMIRNFNR